MGDRRRRGGPATGGVVDQERTRRARTAAQRPQPRPEQRDHRPAAELGSDAGTAHLADLVLDRGEAGNHEFAFRIETPGGIRLAARHHPIGADHLFVGLVHHQQMAAVTVEAVAVEPAGAVLQPPLLLFAHPVAETLGVLHLGRTPGQLDPEIVQLGQHRRFPVNRQPEEMFQVVPHLI